GPPASVSWRRCPRRGPARCCGAPSWPSAKGATPAISLPSKIPPHSTRSRNRCNEKQTRVDRRRCQESAGGRRGACREERLGGHHRHRRRRRAYAGHAAAGRRRADLQPHRAGQGANRRAGVPRIARLRRDHQQRPLRVPVGAVARRHARGRGAHRGRRPGGGRGGRLGREVVRRRRDRAGRHRGARPVTHPLPPEAGPQPAAGVPAGALNPGVARREVWAWAMYDFANSGYTTVILTTVFSTYFVSVVGGRAHWATLAWTAALSLSYLAIMLTMPTL